MRLYFDYISPYAYLAWTQIHELSGRHGRTLQAVPVLFAAMLGEYGHLGPAEIPPKRIYMFKNVLRLARALDVPFEVPPAHPFNPLLALRVSSVPMEDDRRRRLIDGLFRATWAEGRSVEDPDVVGELVEAVGLDWEQTLASATSEAGKSRVRQATEGALADGAFGVPSVVVDGELFWGLDSFPHIEAFLQGRDPVDAEAVRRFAELPASAARRR